MADGVVYVGSNDGALYAVDARIGEERWRVELWDDICSSLAVADGAVFVGSLDCSLVAVGGRD